MKLIAQSILVLIVLAGVGIWGWEKFQPRQQSPATSLQESVPASAESSAGSGHAILVTYFTSNVRCDSCLKIEELTKRTVEERNSRKGPGQVSFQALNIDLPENQRFVESYALSFKTVVISDLRDGKEVSWQKMDDVWGFLDEPDAFASYLSKQIDTYLASNP